MPRFSLRVAAYTAAVVALSGSALGYTYPPLPANQSAIWRFSAAPSPTPGFTRNQLCLNIRVFGTFITEGAVAGFGYSGASIPGIVGVRAETLVFNNVTQTSTQISAISPLPFDSGVTASFNNAGLYPAGAGLNWLGFGNVILPFQPPALGVNESYQHCFIVDVPNASEADFLTRTACATAGRALAETLQPIFDPNIEGFVGAPFGPANKNLPAPGAAALVGLAGLAATRRRR